MFPVGLHCYLVFIQSSKKTGLMDFYVKQSTVSILKKEKNYSTTLATFFHTLETNSYYNFIK